ncbi:dTDP-4-dehydrorhamnose 3,5-epimerase [Microvirga makkahensis]|uniref:dTDP-4-dehydrorhamnose 3,5-epimerase n=1 Tax=Microvirga makkahensis TaxID=1128670 RepID=A0A7X3SR26_9HYPH|nr:dTDP-4-dehydrorhamnose 3,5-epimerase [Microvirga makkahensis]MXQ13729.1 dTDP-4-dehydrorhamnose 3,5-epimerase [Microvirga makkahensis]
MRLAVTTYEWSSHDFGGEVNPTDIPEVILLIPRRFRDERGWFSETYSVRSCPQALSRTAFVQDNQVFSAARGTLRGLHFQRPPQSQAKLVRVLRGRIFDVAVDLRVGSSTYGRWVGATLTAEAGEQLFVPHGFAHGYCTLEPETEVAYKVDSFYTPDCDAGLAWDDPSLDITWPIRTEEVVLSGRDRDLPTFANFVSPFRYEPAETPV